MEIPNTLCSNVYDFAFCPEPCYDRLVDLADPEDWGPSNRILKNYLPCRVRFAEDPSELVFDYRLPIRSNIDHILGDEENLTRIPASLMGEGNSLLLRRAFEGAVVEAARRAAANYTLAVPQFYGGRIQLLLPLCLTGDKPELALTIQREDGFYAARTCLTLDMAYNNARLICRPETSWIKR